MKKRNLSAFGLVLLIGCEGSLVKCNAQGQATGPLGVCAEPDPDERALELLNSGQPLEAIEVLEELVAGAPNEYFRYPRLAAAYAAAGGFELSRFLSAPDDAADPFALIESLLPTRTGRERQFAQELDYMGQAGALLQRIPNSILSDPQLDFAGSARFQLRLYQTTYSLMYLKSFEATTIPTAPGEQPKFTRESLEEMSDQDVEVILSSLESAATIPEFDEADAEVQAQINENLAGIEAQPGSSRKEKLINFLEQREQG